MPEEEPRSQAFVDPGGPEDGRRSEERNTTAQFPRATGERGAGEGGQPVRTGRSVETGTPAPKAPRRGA